MKNRFRSPTISFPSHSTFISLASFARCRSNSGQSVGLLLSFFADHPIDPPVIRTSIPWPFRVRTKFDERGPGDGTSKGDFRVFRRTTDNLFVARTRLEGEKLRGSVSPFWPAFPSHFRYPLFPRAVTYLTRPRDGSALHRECTSFSSLVFPFHLVPLSSLLLLLLRRRSSTSHSSSSVSTLEQEQRPRAK